MSILFESVNVGQLVLKNRFVRSATGESRADRQGFVQDAMLPIYEGLAAGGVGLIISGHMYVEDGAKCSPRQTGIWSDDHISGLTRLAQASQGNDTKTVAQINYATRVPAEMSLDDIQSAADSFVAAAGRAQQAGFDGVQIHAAHGYLLSCFLTPSANARDDQFGAQAEGRRRLLLDIAKRVRHVVGPDYPVLCKLGVVDGKEDSLTLEESVATAVALEREGIDAIEISTTLSGPHAQPAATQIDSPQKEAYFTPLARTIKDALRIPLILVGGIRSMAVMEQLVDEGVCNMVSLCRPFIREPGLVNAFRDGTSERAACVSCNQCYNPRGFRCVFNSE